MCGIAGITALAGSLRSDFPDLLKIFSQSLTIRGPDADGTWVSEKEISAMVHCRLSILDVDARADQPMRSADGRFVLVFNGEIYNYAELRAELEQRGRNFATTSDTEVLLQMYIEHGTEMLNRLRGMYAFAVWDEVERRLVLARDPFGIKPLYYSIKNGQFYFASQVRAMRRIPGMDLRAEPAGHVGFFVWGSVPEPFTLYRGIRCLPSGSFLTVANGQVSAPVKFASPAEEFASFDDAEKPKSEEESYERLHEALKESVRMHLIADVPVSLFLSAGIDSGMITGLAAEAHDGLEALTLGFDEMKGTPADETELAAQVAKRYEVRHYSRYIEKETFRAHRQRLLEQMDQPTIDGVNTYFVSLLARERGYKVALSGLGGDELFGGYPSFQQVPKLLHLLGPWPWLPVVGANLRAITAPVLTRFTSPKYASLLEYGGSWGGAYLLRRGLFMPWEVSGILGRRMAREGWEELASIRQMNALAACVDQQKVQAQGDFLRVSALEMHYYMRTQLLRDADWAGMAHSLEIRVPMVDMTLLRQIAALRASPFRPKKPQVGKSLRTPLPNEVLARQKSGFAIPVREWMGDATEGVPRWGLRSWAMHIYRYFEQLPGHEALTRSAG
jgi:asparagine synthase (glutamine-hydrolysing)